VAITEYLATSLTILPHGVCKSLVWFKIPDFIAGNTFLTHKSLAAHVTLANSPAFAATHVAQTALAHIFTRFAPHSTTVSTSLATQTGSDSNVLAKFSQLPYLSPSICLHSGVAINLYNQTIVSTGFVIPLATALIVFNALHGILAIILANLGHSVPTPTI